MNTLESLNSEFQVIRDWDGKYRRKLTSYINKCLKFCGGAVEIPVRFRTYEEAEKAGESFLGQFPSCVQVMDEEGWDWIYSLYVTKLYKKDGRYLVDGLVFTEDKWLQGCEIDEETDTYEILAGFCHKVLNPDAD